MIWSGHGFNRLFVGKRKADYNCGQSGMRGQLSQLMESMQGLIVESIIP